MSMCFQFHFMAHLLIPKQKFLIMFSHLVENRIPGWCLDETCGQLRGASLMTVSTTEVRMLSLACGASSPPGR